jgi:hypothetical protein
VVVAGGFLGVGREADDDAGQQGARTSNPTAVKETATMPGHGTFWMSSDSSDQSMVLGASRFSNDFAKAGSYTNQRFGFAVVWKKGFGKLGSTIQAGVLIDDHSRLPLLSSTHPK